MGDLGDAGGSGLESSLDRLAIELLPPEDEDTRSFILEGLMTFSWYVPVPLPMTMALRVLPREVVDVIPIAADLRGLKELGLMLPPLATPMVGLLEE